MHRRLFKNCFLFAIGGGAFYLFEVLSRGYSHFLMWVVGGLCFLFIGQINERELTQNLPLLLQMAIGAIGITLIELIAGLILNIWLKMHIWNYSNLPGNLWGQICPQYTFIWFLLSGIAILLDDYIRHWFFGKEKPKYKLL